MKNVMSVDNIAEKKQTEKSLMWVKSLLNNLPLLKWVKRFSADNLLNADENIKIAKRFGLKTTEESIAIPDKTLTKVLFTHSKYNDKEYTRFNLKQLSELIQVLGNEGELIIRESVDREMVVQIGNTTIVVCPIIRDRGVKNE